MNPLTFFFIQNYRIEQCCDCRKSAVVGKSKLRMIKRSNKFFKIVTGRIFETRIIVACRLSQSRVRKSCRLINGKRDCASLIAGLIINPPANTNCINIHIYSSRALGIVGAAKPLPKAMKCESTEPCKARPAEGG